MNNYIITVSDKQALLLTKSIVLFTDKSRGSTYSSYAAAEKTAKECKWLKQYKIESI